MIMCAKKIFPTSLHLHRQREPLYKAEWIHGFMLLRQILMDVAEEIEIHQTRRHVSNLVLSNFSGPVPTVASVSCY